jgi:hypothetical protein
LAPDGLPWDPFGRFCMEDFGLKESDEEEGEDGNDFLRP